MSDQSDDAQNPAPESSLKDKFPEGLRVLAVDDNVVCLKLLATLLIKCRYKVTVTTKATEALEMLRKNKDSYDIVITDVEMLDMDGFQLLEIIGLEMDMPVIMMSANDETESVMKGIKHGARDYLLKPVRMEELKNIWQHVVRKNLFQPTKPGSFTVGTEHNPMPSKRQRNKGKEKEKEKEKEIEKEKEKEKEDETYNQSDGECSTQKKQRLNWTPELHNKFVDAVQMIGVNKAVPKKILEILNVPDVSRENVASHLQKYRNGLRKEEKKAKINIECENNIDSNRTNGHLSNTRTVSSNNQGLNYTIKHRNISANQSINNPGVVSFCSRLQQTFGASPADKGPLFYALKGQDNFIQQNLLPSQVADQISPNMAIPVFGSVPPALTFAPNPTPQPELDGMMRFHSMHQRTNMVDDYMDISSSHVPSFDAGPLVPYSCPPGGFNAVGFPFPMLGDASNQLIPISRPEPLAIIPPTLLYGKHEGGGLVGLNGRGELSGYPFDRQLINDSIRDVHFVPQPSENAEGEISGHCNNFGPPEDDLSVMLKQFSSSSAPPRL